MNHQDQSLVILAGIGFFSGIIAFFVRRNKGKTRALATAFAIWTFGCILAAGILFGFVPLSKHSMGLERFVVPFVILIATGIASVIFGLLVHLFEYRKVESAESLSLEAQVLLQNAEHDASDRRILEPESGNSGLPEWKRFAIQASKQPGTL